MPTGVGVLWGEGFFALLLHLPNFRHDDQTLQVYEAPTWECVFQVDSSTIGRTIFDVKCRELSDGCLLRSTS